MKRNSFTFIFVLIFNVYTFASGSSVGPRPTASQTSDGWRPGPLSARETLIVSPKVVIPQTDLKDGLHQDNVKFVKINGSEITFQYKSFEKLNIEVHTLHQGDVEKDYLNALRRSSTTKQWEAVDLKN